MRTVISEEIAKHTANFDSPFSSSEPPLPSPPFHEQSLPSPTFHDPYAPDSQMDHMANALSEYKQLVPQLINQVKELQQTVKDLKLAGPPTNITSDTSTVTSNTTSSSNINRFSFRRPFHMYCHTHGLCAHNGKQCNDPGTHHKKDATFFHRMNGSNRNCDRAIRLN